MSDKEKYYEQDCKIMVGGNLFTLVLLIILLLTIPQASSKAQTNTVTPDSSSHFQASKRNRQMKLVKAILSSSRDVWYKLFNEQLRKYYDDPNVVFYTSKIESICGYKNPTGSYYCFLNRTIYIDLSIYDELNTRFVSSADFAMIYIVTHLIGHHIQNLLGSTEIIGEQENETSEIDVNNISIAFELQADFYAGVWAHYNQKVRNLIVTGNMEEAMYAANAIGTDRMKMIQQGFSVPENLNHGTSSQRIFWYNKGFETGDIQQGDTFKDTNR